MHSVITNSNYETETYTKLDPKDASYIDQSTNKGNSIIADLNIQYHVICVAQVDIDHNTNEGKSSIVIHVAWVDIIDETVKSANNNNSVSVNHQHVSFTYT